MDMYMHIPDSRLGVLKFSCEISGFIFPNLQPGTGHLACN